MLSDDPAQRHRQVSRRFAEIAGGVADWGAPSPVPEWSARDVVAHLVEWFPGFLKGGGVTITRIADSDDPAARWAAHASVVGELFADGDREFVHPYVGTHRLADAIDRFYTSDIFMHSWDLARSAGIDPGLDADFAASMLLGMQPLDEMLRGSGQYGPKVEISPEASAVDRLMAFVGRDPAWMPGSRAD